ncbi:MAG: hypothetical protein ACYCW6_07795, partial [Candidatus Xenobia bacterium]
MSRRIFTGQVLLVSLGIDLTFAILTTFAYLVFLGVLDRPARHDVLLVVAMLYVVKTLAWMLLFRNLLAPIEVWRRRRYEDVDLREVIRHAGTSIYNVPLTLGSAWALMWGLFFVAASIALTIWQPFELPPRVLPATLLFALGPGCGSMAVIVPMLTYFMAPLAGKISLHARQVGVAIDGIRFSFANRVAMLTFCLALAPTCWMAGMAYELSEPTAAFG